MPIKDFLTYKDFSYNTYILLEMLRIIDESRFQDKELKNLFGIKKNNAKRKYNKEKYQKYINYLLRLGKIAYNELFLNCNANETYSKIYRLNFEKSSNTVSFGENHYILMTPKTFHLKHFSVKNEPTINKYKKIYLKYLNQKVSFQIYEDKFYYYIETFLRLPNYSENVKYWIKKQIDWYTLKLLKDGKLVKKTYSDKITQNIKKIVKNRSYRQDFIKGYSSILTLLSKIEREKYLLGIRDLRYKKSEICFFHNVRLKINGKLMVILRRDINELMVKEVLGEVVFDNIRDLFEIFSAIGLNAIGIDKRDVTSLELVSFEVARKLNGFDKTKHRNIPILKYGKNSRKRDLGYKGFENFYDYIDYSSIDDYGNPIPEYEIQYFNRKNKSIDDILRDLDFLLDFERIEPIIDTDIIKIESFDIAPSIEKRYSIRNDFPLEYKSYNELQGFSNFSEITPITKNYKNS